MKPVEYASEVGPWPSSSFSLFFLFPFFSITNSSNHPLAARNEGEKARGDPAADECEDCDDGDGCPHGYDGVGGIALDEDCTDGREEEEVHEIHSKGELRSRRKQARCLLSLNAGEEEEGSEGGQYDIWCAELPTPLEQRRLNEFAGRAAPPERPCREGGSNDETYSA